jgi:hypothetical protein
MRGYSGVEDGSPNERGIAAAPSSPSKHLANQELLDEFRKCLSEGERQLAEQRALGRGWAEIAAAAGGMPEDSGARTGGLEA